MGSDFWLAVRFWAVLFLLGAAAYPLSKRLFSDWWDRGYVFSKAVGIGLVTYLTFLAGTFHILPFTTQTVLLIIVLLAATSLLSLLELRIGHGELGIRYRNKAWSIHKEELATIFASETFFFLAFLFWSWVKGHEASIRALEKFMDYGFTRSILNSSTFPAPDMWFAGYPINYYYFGHIVMALLTKLSGIDLGYTFNLMLAAIFALTITMSFSIGYQLLVLHHGGTDKGGRKSSLLSGVLTGFLVTLAGNMQTIYAFTQGYTGENVKPFWHLLWPAREFLTKFTQGLEIYWYANATRFIPFTIHEFPSYSFVVSDLHGHVLAIPFALLAIAFLIQLYGTGRVMTLSERLTRSIGFGFLGSLLLMTNALDGPIYILLFFLLLGLGVIRSNPKGEGPAPYAWTGLATALAWIFGSLPFLAHFRSFVTGLAVNCPPAALASSKFGPFLFEGVEKCQHSPLWMWWLLWGFFVYCGVWFLARSGLTGELRKAPFLMRIKGLFFDVPRHETILAVFFLFSLCLVIFPEFFYFKDIYPQHFRSNTMFKLGYQAFIMFSIVSGYAIVTQLTGLLRRQAVNVKVPLPGRSGRKARNRVPMAVYADPEPAPSKLGTVLFLLLLIPQLFLVSIYPLFSVRSYFGGLREYQGLYGLNWMINEYPDDYNALLWLTKNYGAGQTGNTGEISERDCAGRVIRGSYFPLPVIVEADGDSYTDYNHFSAFAGLPTIAGWAVHEWLWRGCYDIVGPRREEVRQVYESTDPAQVREILQKYHVAFIIIGKLEREKFQNLQEQQLMGLGTIAYRSHDTLVIEPVQSEDPIKR